MIDIERTLLGIVLLSEVISVLNLSRAADRSVLMYDPVKRPVHSIRLGCHFDYVLRTQDTNCVKTHALTGSTDIAILGTLGNVTWWCVDMQCGIEGAKE